jgi:hypothetical protein
MQQDVVLRFTETSDYKGTLRSYLAPGDQVAFERKFSMPLTAMDDEKSMRVEWILWVVWRAYSREPHGFEGDFEAFLSDLTEYEFPEAEEIPPTETAPLE